MSVWKMRHLGAAEFTAGLTLHQITDGIQEGFWEPTDEVKGPTDAEWVALEKHPIFEAALADFEMEKKLVVEEETRLDMNPLIDVSLVLLIFFILTTTYDEMRKEYPAPAGEQDQSKAKAMTNNELKKFTIRITVVMKGDEPEIQLENQVIPEAEIQKAIEDQMAKTGFNQLAVEVAPKVPWRVFMAIQDAAAGAKITDTIRITRK